MRVASERSAQILLDLTRAAAGAGAGDVAGVLVRTCAAALPVTGVGLVWTTDSGPGSMLAASDGPAGVMEELQFTVGEGPCVESSSTGRPVLQPDLAQTGPARWPVFASGALDAGVCAVFAFPLQLGGHRVGVLDLYRDRVGPLSEVEIAEALAFAEAATTILWHLQADDVALHSLLIEAVDHRAVVHQATGMIAVQVGVAPADALVILRARSFALERGIISVAADVVARTLRFDE